ncbi:hypothetical protein P1P68_15470 [Streptomyces scabiei]|uniref:hypothetical protein n=1 Tax=Streptomyces scabiei TaxID=1930 RepID=UPI00298F52CE|nr:hypothetical protein [Streptomyces scabiei]MDW8806148.1 hypothetical protein [Streptomyces scabiei]
MQDNKRVAARVTVICLALLVSCLIERQVRRALGSDQKMPGLCPGNQQVRPPGRMIPLFLSLLFEPYQEGDSDLAHAAAPLLSKMPKNIVWDQVDFVTVLLKTASRLSEDLFRRTGGSLHSAVLSGFRFGTPGQPYQEDLDISERAQRIRAGLPRGSAVDLFYKALVDSAQRNIDRASTDDLS